MLTLEGTTNLTPARVVRVANGRVQLELPDGVSWATVALAFPYQVVDGDYVLAIGKADEWFVIGVLKGRGPTAFTVPGDLSIGAPHGRLQLTARDGIAVSTQEFSVFAHRIELVATSVLERFGRVARWVTGVCQLRAGRLRTRVEGGYDLHADRISERATKHVKIDGEKIHLG